ncbi:MAG: methyltransferase domain-containing protein [Alphaproteobacteria bacterium]|nr:methyltransferase domain-containing protein [Alphaproteobacteria bacterium]
MTDATTYDWDEAELARLELQAAHTWQVLLPLLARGPALPGATIVDLGCGPGRVTARLATAVGAAGTVLGVDHDPALLARAMGGPRTADAGTCRWVHADAAAVDLPDATADAVVAHMLLQHVPDPAAVVREAARLLRPGGLLVVVDVDDALIDVHPRDPGLQAVLEASARAQAARGGDRAIGRRLAALARAAGLDDVHAAVTLFCSPPLPAPVVFAGSLAFRPQLVAADDLAATQATLARIQARLTAPDAWLQAGVYATTAVRR